MLNKILAKEKINQFFSIVKQNYDLFLPIIEEKKIVWALADESGANKLILDFSNTEMSPKSFFFPQTECMMRFLNKADDHQGMIMQAEPLLEQQRILFNIRPCDAKAIHFLDSIFIQDEITNDIYWKNKREKTILFGLACNKPSSTCFCTNVNCGPHHELGLDILLIDLGENILVKTLTPKGYVFTEKLPLSTALEDKQAIELKIKAEAAINNIINIKKINSSELMSLYELPMWNEAMEACLNCGFCTFCCPTCHCFDIIDEVQGEVGRRLRIWDYCMSWLFTLHASGHNPRGLKKERFRQRFMHKFKYIPMKRGKEIGCVGCGRCINFCPVNIDIRSIINQMNIQLEGR